MPAEKSEAAELNKFVEGNKGDALCAVGDLKAEKTVPDPRRGDLQRNDQGAPPREPRLRRTHVAA